MDSFSLWGSAITPHNQIQRQAGETSNYLLSHTLPLEGPWDAYQIKSGGWRIHKDWSVPEGGGGVSLFRKSILTQVPALNAKQSIEVERRKEWSSPGVTCNFTLIIQSINDFNEALQPVWVNTVSLLIWAGMWKLLQWKKFITLNVWDLKRKNTNGSQATRPKYTGKLILWKPRSRVQEILRNIFSVFGCWQVKLCHWNSV